MNRAEMLARMQDSSRPWDLLIIGGGATGLGAAVDAAARGYRTLLLEQADIAKGTSSRSTKLAHGGVRYLRQGQVSLVLHALHERGLMLRNAPHLVHDLSFIVPLYRWWEPAYYSIGLRAYDLLAGRYSFGRSVHLSKDEAVSRIPTIETAGLRGGVLYHDGQFDDARLAVNLAQTAADHGAAVLNYVQVVGLTKSNGLVDGVRARDLESGNEHELKAKVVINATGVFADAVRKLDEPAGPPMLTPSQGTHLVLPRSFLPGDTALMVPKTDDGRVLFVIPWHGHALVGTTDTPVAETSLEPRPLEEEIQFLLDHARRYLAKDPEPSDVLSIFAGLRPLVTSGGSRNTASLSRDHVVEISPSRLVTVTGGKWTTYRRMAEDVVNQAAAAGELEARACVTRELPIHGSTGGCGQRSTGGSPVPFPTRTSEPPVLHVYGSDAPAVEALAKDNPDLQSPLHPDLPYTAAQVIWAVRQEMARTVEDVLSRRLRALQLNARASAEMAPRVAELMAGELGRDEAWQRGQVGDYGELARGYILKL